MRGLTQRRIFAGLCLLLVWQTGCAAFRPVHGVPARYLPSDMKIGERSGRKTIDLSLLRQPPPPAHLVDSGDVLGVYIEGIVGKASDPPPVFFPQNGDTAPSFGLPFPVRDDGTISLPYVGAVNLRGLTIMQAEEKVTKAYLEPKEILKRDVLRVQVNLQRPRQYRVLVIRQDSRSEPTSNGFLGQVNIGMVKRGTGKVVNLPAYSNDVLNALTATDGLPGLDAENAVYVIRRRSNARGGSLEQSWPLDFDPSSLIRQNAAADGPVIRGQSPQDGSESSSLHSPMMRFAPNPYRMERASRYPTGVRPDGNPMPIPNEFVPSGSIQPPRIWADRTSDSMDVEAMQGGYVTGVSGPPANSSQFPLGIGSSTPNPPVGNGYGYGSVPLQGTNNGYPTLVPESAGAYSGSGPSGYPGQSVYFGSGSSGVPPGNGVYPSPPGAIPTTPNPQHSGQGFSNPQSVNQPLPNQPYSVAVPGSQGTISPEYYPVNTPYPDRPVPGGPTPVDSVTGNPNSSNASMIQPTNPAAYGPVPPGMPSTAGPAAGPNLELGAGHTIAGNGLLDGRHVVRIPIRLGPGETADIRPEDVILYDGDIVFIESRDTEVFYTGGLLGGGQYTLPRDYDLDILQALSLAQSRTTGGVGNAIGGVSALNNDVSISPSTAIVLRKLPDGGEVPIKIDLYRARTDLSERIFIQPGDFILLQYTPLEAVAAFFERHLLETALFGLAAQQLNKTGTAN